MAEKKQASSGDKLDSPATPKTTQIIKPVYPVEIYQGAKIVFCKTCGDQLRTDLSGKVFCSQGKTKSQCPLLKKNN